MDGVLSFSDDDLKQVKNAMVPESDAGYWFSQKALESLLGRLEAAEASRHPCFSSHPEGCMKCREWRKAAGK